MKRSRILVCGNGLFRGPCCLEDVGKPSKMAVLTHQSAWCHIVQDYNPQIILARKIMHKLYILSYNLMLNFACYTQNAISFIMDWKWHTKHIILKKVPPTVPIRVITRACLTTYNSHFSIDLWPSAQKLYVERNKAKLSCNNKHVRCRLLRTLTHICFNHVNLYKAPNTLSVTLSYFTVWCHTWRKNWVYCAVLTGNSASLRTVLSSHLSHRELHSSLRESQFRQFTCWHHDGIISRYIRF
jgi:hypothetical protein